MTVEKKTLGDLIRQTRKEMKLTQEDFGKLLGVGKSSINMWESGKRTPRFKVLQRLIEITGIDPYQFLPAFEDDVYFTEEEKELLMKIDSNFERKKKAPVDLTDVSSIDNIELTEDEKEEVLRFTRFLVSKREL